MNTDQHPERRKNTDRRRQGMTDRIHSLTIILDENLLEEEVLGLKSALLSFKHVIDVKSHVVDYSTVMAESRARARITKRLVKLWQEEMNR